VADFYCPEARLVLEVDGGVHTLQDDADRARQEWLEQARLTVLRIRNEDVLSDVASVLARIAKAARAAEPHPPVLSPQAERGWPPQADGGEAETRSGRA
jgi:very-short-patch-repair endonuclease